MPFRANLLEQMIFLTTNIGPKPIIDIWSALALPVVQAAVETGIFVSLRGQNYTYEDIVEWLDSAGCDVVRRVDLRRTPGVTVVVWRKR